jgi:hypothetical protein
MSKLLDLIEQNTIKQSQYKTMSSSSSSSSGGIGFTGLLTVLFVGLKLTGHITWSWWVLSPIWISLSLLLFVFLILGMIFLISELSK